MNRKNITVAKVIEVVGLVLFFGSLGLILIYVLDHKFSFSFDVSEDLIIYPLFAGLLLILISALWLRSKSVLWDIIGMFTYFH